MITHTCPYFHSSLDKQFNSTTFFINIFDLELGHGKVITSDIRLHNVIDHPGLNFSAQINAILVNSLTPSDAYMHQ